MEDIAEYKRVTAFEYSMMKAVKTQTELNSVRKLLWTATGLSDCERPPELSQDEMQSLGIDYDSDIAALLGLYKFVLNK